MTTKAHVTLGLVVVGGIAAVATGIIISRASASKYAPIEPEPKTIVVVASQPVIPVTETQPDPEELERQRLAEIEIERDRVLLTKLIERYPRYSSGAATVADGIRILISDFQVGVTKDDFDYQLKGIVRSQTALFSDLTDIEMEYPSARAMSDCIDHLLAASKGWFIDEFVPATGDRKKTPDAKFVRAEMGKALELYARLNVLLKNKENGPTK